MNKTVNVIVWSLICALVCFSQSAPPTQRKRVVSPAAAKPKGLDAQLTGVYRIDLARSDKLYSVVANASSRLPFGEQQKFFIDLTVRLTPPDLLAIERRAARVAIASSRAPRIAFVADGVTHQERGADGQLVSTRAALRANQLTVSVSGRSDEPQFSVAFESVAGGRFLRVTRRLSDAQLNEPVVIRSMYEKVSDVAQWDIYGAPTPPSASELNAATTTSTAPEPNPSAAITAATARGNEGDEFALLRRTLDQWIAATNARDIRGQLEFYAPVLKAFYLTRNVSRAAVRAEKARVFQQADSVDVRAEAPEIIFQEAGQTAIMRFRKRYAIESGAQPRRGEVVQELRWRRGAAGWKIFSERDVRVIR